MNMGIAIIILACFIVLFVVVIYKLGRKLEAKDHQIKAIKAEIEKQKAMTESTVTVWVLDELLTFIDKQEKLWTTRKNMKMPLNGQDK